MQSYAPLQVQLMVSEANCQRFDLSLPSVCTLFISFFVEAAEDSYCFSAGRNLHRLYEKVMALSCSTATPRNISAVANLCRAARKAGFATTVTGPPAFFESFLTLDDRNSAEVSEAWLLGTAESASVLEDVWKKLAARGTAIVCVESPDVAARLMFLDHAAVSGSSFRIVSPSVFARMWPAGFCIDEEGDFSRPIICPRSNISVASINELLSGALDAQPGAQPRSLRSLDAAR